MKHILFIFLLIISSLFVYGQDDGRRINIPVVFHVMYVDKSEEEGIGNPSEYLPKEKLIAELNDLDSDFQCLNKDINIVIPEFKGVVGNSKIHFYLADIVYVKIKSWGPFYERYNSERLHRYSPVQNPEKCLNVYIGRIKFDGGWTNGVTPVKAQLEPDLKDDAVNINFKWVGLHYRLLTHETGHWLGLWHTFQPTEQGDEDGITDIPIQDTWTDMECDICPPQVKDQLSAESKAKGFKHSNYNNFMDYSGCRVMFSVQQVNRMRYVIKNFRPALWNN